jgi:hypothetical protein
VVAYDSGDCVRSDDSQRAALRYGSSRTFTALKDVVAIEPVTIRLSIRRVGQRSEPFGWMRFLANGRARDSAAHDSAWRRRADAIGACQVRTIASIHLGF